uniref:Ycf1 n=1 Tax=Pseudobryopsis hainanensis TaxID=2320808 RepID=A0A3S7SXM7_9CHLO|nr:hypothetical protein Ycf1 [Pseudobryopsis hainanensis]
MSVSQEIKNYVDFLSEFGNQESNSYLSSFLGYNLFYLFGWIKTGFIWLISFSWLRDFCQLPVDVVSWSTTIFSETFLPHNSVSAALNYEAALTDSGTHGFHGLINGFFLSLPCSAVSLLWLRQLVVQGIPAGIVSAAGIIIGHTGLFVCTALGFRFLVFTWFSLEPGSYFLGIALLLWVVYRMTHTPIKRLKWQDQSTLIGVFLSSAALVWTDQIGLFGYLNNLTLSSHVSVFSIGATESTWGVFRDVLTLILGQCLGFLFFGWLCLVLGRSLVGTWVPSYSRWVQIFNFASLTFVIAFTLTSFPHYSLDYLFFSPLGFSSTDGCLSPLQLQTTLRDVSRGRLGECSSHTSLDVDVAPFDRGSYSTGSEIELTFEDLNYQGEYIWRSRNDRLASGSGGVVNKFMSKFLPKSTSSEALMELDQSFQARPYETAQNLFSPTQWDRFEGFTERFLEDYGIDSDESIPSRGGENGEPFSAFSELVKYGFDTFASLDEIASDEFEEALGKKIKLKYYANPVYKLLLRVDISHFLSRQPRAHFLTQKEERELFQRRCMITRYYDSLRSYSTIPYASAFYDLFFGSKSYASRVYNQQFKGTLKILRRLFAINVYSQDPELSTVLKFDQPLYNSPGSQLFIHEELIGTNGKKSSDLGSSQAWLRETHSMPLYAGWDYETRRFIITNRWAAARTTLLATSLPSTNNLNQSNFGSDIEFTAWPLESRTNKNEYSLMYEHADLTDNQQHDLHDLFEYAEAGDYETRLIYETLPSFLRRVDLRNKDKNQVRLAPRTNGFRW